MSAAPSGEEPEIKLSVAELRKLARAKAALALRVLAEVADKGKSEASRISAALALLERGYGKSGAGLVPDASPRPPILHHWIELIDGTEDKTDPDHCTFDQTPRQAGDHQD